VESATGAGGRRIERTDEAGRARFESVPEGTAAIRVEHPGFAEDLLIAEIQPGREEELQAVLLPEISDTVTITATRLEAPVSALPNTVTLVDQQALKEQTALRDDLAGVLEMTVPGFGPSLEKLTGRGESLRGRNPLFTINGVPQFNPLRDGQRDGHTIDMDFVERIEVVHGSNAIQGIGATGGVVNLVTKSPRSDGAWTHDLKLTMGSNGGFHKDGFSKKLSYLLGKRFDQLEFVVGLAVHDRDLFYDARNNPIGLYPTQGDLMDSTSRGLYVKATYTLSTGQSFDFALNDFRLERNGNYVVVPGNRAAGRPTSSKPGDPRPLVGDPAANDVTSFSFSYRNQDLKGGEFLVQSYFHDYSALFEGGTFGGLYRLTPDGPPFLDQSEILSTKLGLKLTYRLKDRTWFGFTPTAGLDLSDDRTSQVLARSNREWVPETGLTELSPFIQVERPVFERVLFSAGARIGNARLRVDDYTTIPSAGGAPVRGGSPTDTEFLPNVGMVFDAGKGLSLFASYSEGYTMPDVGRVLRDVGEPGADVDTLVGVEPVVSSNAEFGAKLSNGRFNLQTAYYHSASDLGSRLDPDRNGFFRVRREATRIDGIDLSGSIALTDRIDVGGTYAWIQGRYDSTGDGRVDTDLDGTNIAPNRLNSHLNTRIARFLNARFQVSRFFDRDFDGLSGSSNVKFVGFTLTDLLFSLESQLGTFRFGVRNVFDRYYITYFGQTEPFGRSDTYFAGPGRSLHLQYERRF